MVGDKRCVFFFFVLLFLFNACNIAFYNPFHENAGKTSTVYETTDFTGSVKIKFDTTPDGADVDGDVGDFPVLVRITDQAVIDATRPGAPDIRFLDMDGTTWLDYEIERWDQGGNYAEVWVLVPVVHGNSDSDYITMYYDDVIDGSVADGMCPSCVFDSSNGFAGVWHLAEDAAGTGSAALYNDSTDNVYHGDDYTAATVKDGVVGQGQEFAEFPDYVNVPYNLGDLDFGSGRNFTVSAWVKTTQAAAAFTWPLILSKEDNEAPRSGYNLVLHDANTDARWSLEIYVSGVQSAVMGSSDIADGEWHYVVGMRIGSDIVAYEDGDYANTTAASSASISRDCPLSIGVSSENRYDVTQFTGSIDEVTISKTERSADWIKLSFANQKAAQTLITFE
ncbi:MAG: DUF2341 domain-containing protein [Spirochaetales bacterium]|nr:DUF2341 domain-containing protein [Spirochaetales bacterium]